MKSMPSYTFDRNVTELYIPSEGPGSKGLCRTVQDQTIKTGALLDRSEIQIRQTHVL